MRASCSSWSNSGTLLPFPSGYQEAEGEARGGLRRRDSHGAKLSVRSDGAEALVQLLVEEARVAHHAAGFRKKEFLIVELQTLDESGDKSGKVVGGILKQLAGSGIALISSADNHRKNPGEHFIRSTVGEGLHFVPGGNLEFPENQFAHRGVGAGAIEFVNGGDGSAPADIEGAAFIAEKRAVAANAGDLAMGIASNGGGTGAGNQDDGGTFASGFESKLEIGADNHGLTGEFLLEETLHFSLGVRMARAGQARAKSGDLREWDIGGVERGTRGFTNRSECAAKSNTHGIGGPAAAARADAGGFIHENAFRLGATTIEAENVAHSQSIREAGRG